MKICPRCGSEKIRRDKSDWLGFLGFQQSYTCGECDYSGKLFLEIDRERLQEAKETLKNVGVPDLDSATTEHFNPVKFTVGIVLIFLGIPPLIYSAIPGDFLIGIISAFFGIALMRNELVKRKRGF